MLYVALEGQIRVNQVKVNVWESQGWQPAAGRRVKIWEAGQIKNFLLEVFEFYIVK